MKIGYAREGLEENNLEEQVEKLKTLGVEKIYKETRSGQNMQRHYMNQMFMELQAGDTLYITDLFRISRDLHDITTIVEELTKREVTIISLRENFNTNTERGKDMMDAFRAVLKVEHESFLEREKEAVNAVKTYRYGMHKPMKNQDKFEEVYKLWCDKEITATEAAKRLDISRKSFYYRLEKMNRIMTHS